MRGWQLRQPDLKKDDWFVITRNAPNGNHLVLSMNPKQGYVHFHEHERGGYAFSASCKDIRFVDIEDKSITFRGNVDYKITFDGKFHDIKLSNSDFGDASIAGRSYDFPDTD